MRGPPPFSLMYEKKDPSLPTLTVVTPAYNQADFLRDSIESVLSQDYPNIEYVVLDDGSTDDTPRILAEYGDRFVWESQKNMGQTPTINKGWGQTRGEIITWLNSDDTFYDAGSVRTGMEYLMANPVSLISPMRPKFVGKPFIIERSTVSS